jgi:Zn-dependent protease with chaperone function
LLSFWVTAFFFERYFIKLIVIVGVAALGAAVVLIRSIFRKPNDKLEVEGEPIERDQSPALWSRIEALCAKLGTEPPRTILGGIDNNFFVTEHPVHAGERVYEGRSLFVSLSLLTRLSKSEADAVLAHEMAHFSGGDTSFSTKLSPLLTRYVHYLEALYASVLSRPVFYFMLFYWSLFQFSLGRQRRERELRADKLAAEATSADSIGNALLKVAAYSRYRQRVEQGKFDRNRVHSDLDIALSVTAGFAEYARGHQLTADLQEEGAVPHPFDSHPSLQERLANVGLSISDDAFVDRVVSTEAQTWFSEIGEAPRIESALWDAYESRFRGAHELALAYRYLPANDAERAHVERFFPPVSIAGKEHALAIDCEKLSYGAWENALRWDDITNLEVKDKTFRGRVLVVGFNRLKSVDTTELPLKELTQPEAQVLEVLSRYYARALTAKQHLES